MLRPRPVVTANGSVPRPTISPVRLRAGESEERITSVASWQDSPYLTAAERAALVLIAKPVTGRSFTDPCN
ncbi:hypothetical protein [Streptomyces sp. NPDC127098]|uniref:hypothetical protein n=1 Tax=Streptomyces sp. NPDC127098 TaxID=3347137 RepID=UPI003662EE23